MAAPVQQVQPLPNGTIPIMPGVPQSIVYQQQPLTTLVPQQQVQYTPRRPYIPRERHPNEEQCKIFVGGVGKETSEETLRQYFGKFGEIADSVIMMNKMTGQPRGFAFVTFKEASSVQAVIDQNNNGGHTLDGKVYLQVRKYFPKAEYDAERANNQGGHPNGNPQYKGPMKVAPELKIFVGGIGIGTTEEDIKRYFEQFGGKVTAVDMPNHHVYKCPKGFAFVGFEKKETVQEVCKDRYHQINGKTVEVKGAIEQQEHMKKKQEAMSMGRGHPKLQAAAIQPGSIATVSGYGAYAPALAPGLGQQIVVPQVPTVPAAGTAGYVFDPATNTYYQLPGGTLVAGAAGGLAAAGGAVAGAAAAASPYAGLVLGAAGAQQVIAAPQIQAAPGVVTAEMMQGIPAGTAAALGQVYPNETSMVGPQRGHVVGAAGQQRIAGNTVADPHVVYSTSASISAGDGIPTRGGAQFHPYGR